MRYSFAFVRDYIPRMVQHLGVPVCLFLVFGIVHAVRLDTDALAWAAFVLAAVAHLRRAHDDAMREWWEERIREMDREVARMLAEARASESRGAGGA